MDLEENPTTDTSFASDLAQETTKAVVVTAATIAAAYGTALLVTSAWTGAKKLAGKFTKKKPIVEDTTVVE